GVTENVKDDNVEEGITDVEQKDENVEEEKEKKKVPDDTVWDKTKAIVPFVDYHGCEIYNTQSSTEDAEYDDNVSGVTHVIDEANVAGASNAVDSQETLNFTKKEVPKKINVKVVVKTSAKDVEVPHNKVVDVVKKKVAALTQFKQPRHATKIIKDNYQTPKRGRKRVAQVLEEDVVLRGKRMPPHMVENKKKVIEKRRTVFNENIKYILKEAKKKIFNDVHLVFFPCIKLSEEEEISNHYYLICFNMMTDEIGIIDNIHNDLEDLDLRYGPYAMALEVPKKINVKVVVKTSAKDVEVPHNKVVDVVKKKVAALTQFKQPRHATKIIKDNYQTPKRGRKRVAQVLEEDVVLRGKRMDLNCDALVVNRHEPPHMVENKKKVIEKRRTVFNENIKYILKEAKKKIFNDVHLVFFPCIKLSEEEEVSNHYYLICFNMMTDEIGIIDNIHNDLEDLDLRYGPYAMALVRCSASM
nr:hypothetical protein [Tanacetum cinerariifolium]